uniref:Uncharacterized protein LOC102805555 n=1 Tax=Saccoglossus kowalevskii TaxID=10224 RepID=A0ABM0MPP8_SACKO
PSKPEGTLNVISINAQSCKLKWNPPCDGDSTIIRYIIQQRAGTKREWTTVSNQIPPNVTSYDVTNLKLSTEYYFRVCAEYAVGRSEYLESNGIIITFDPSSGLKIMYRGRAMMLGASGAGKTSTVRAVFGEPFNKKHVSTDGIEIFRFDTDWRKVKGDSTEAIESAHIDAIANTIELKQKPREAKGAYSNVSSAKIKGDTDRIERVGKNEEVYNELVERLKDAKDTTKEDYCFTLFDFGGQEIYYISHQVFTQGKCLYIIVTDISKKLDDQVTDQEGQMKINHELKTVKEFILYWVNTILTYAAQNEDDEYPKIVIVATKADKISQGRPVICPKEVVSPSGSGLPDFTDNDETVPLEVFTPIGLIACSFVDPSSHGAGFASEMRALVEGLQGQIASSAGRVDQMQSERAVSTVAPQPANRKKHRKLLHSKHVSSGEPPHSQPRLSCCFGITDAGIQSNLVNRSPLARVPSGAQCAQTMLMGGRWSATDEVTSKASECGKSCANAFCWTKHYPVGVVWDQIPKCGIKPNTPKPDPMAHPQSPVPRLSVWKTGIPLKSSSLPSVSPPLGGTARGLLQGGGNQFMLLLKCVCSTKSTGGGRPVLDLDRLNRYVLLDRFHMETPYSILLSIHCFDWLASLDLSRAYLHIPMHPASCHLFRDVQLGQVFESRVPPLRVMHSLLRFTGMDETGGAAASPIVGTHLSDPDDWLLHNPNKGLLVRLAQDLLHQLGS